MKGKNQNSFSSPLLAGQGNEIGLEQKVLRHKSKIMENSEIIGRAEARPAKLWPVTLHAVLSAIGIVCCFMGLPEAVCGILGTYFVLVACFMISVLLDPQRDLAYAHRVKVLLCCMVAVIALAAIVYVVH